MAGISRRQYCRNSAASRATRVRIFCAGSQGNHAELLVLTMWESMEAVRKFAGDSPNTAVVESAAQAMLEQFETVVDHYDVVVSAA
jgi:hypothetical protein